MKAAEHLRQLSAAEALVIGRREQTERRGGFDQTILGQPAAEFGHLTVDGEILLLAARISEIAGN